MADVKSEGEQIRRLTSGHYGVQNVRNMSDLYIELLTRIPVVAERTPIGTLRLQEAQKRAGLSNEAVARRVHVSEKTWRRWKIEGTIPTPSLPAVAGALGLELRELAPSAPLTAEVDLREIQDDIARRHDAVMARLDRIEDYARAASIAAAAALDRV